MGRRKAKEKAFGKPGEDVVEARVAREPLEVSPPQVSSPRSADLVGALDAKARGNASFTDGSLAEALDLYREALQCLQACPEHSSKEVLEEVGKVHSNMAECHLRQERWPDAIASASAALEADASNVKAFFRRAKAHEALGQASAAIEDLQSFLRAHPGHQQAKAMFVRLSSGGDIEKPPPSSRPAPLWTTAVSPVLQREWLVDCYRLRVDDTYVFGGDTRGMYSEECGGGSGNGITSADFLLFCKLAVQHGVVPDNWDWAAFLTTAKGLLRYAFEKSDAQEKYGVRGERLRGTAEVVFGSSCMSMMTSEAEAEMEERIEAHRSREELYQDVGGIAVWREASMAPKLRSGKGVGRRGRRR